MRQVLDHGYVKFIECWGTGLDGVDLKDYEVGIIEAARQSTQGTFRGWENDQKLLDFLYKNNHSTPFEFSGMTIEIRAPIMVFREWHRHRTQSYSEASARYSPLEELDYVPLVDRIILNEAGANKQAQAVKGTTLDPVYAYEWVKKLEWFYQVANDFYNEGLSKGIPKELARLPMPVGHYSKMRATTDLRNWLSFMTLRCDPKAQYEIRQYANVVSDIIKEKFPKTYKLFTGE